ncbi:hypothetical protein Cch01nite_23600 [Cellulomonas chitinilytica]|uniref:OCRE domain-containing protein n=1 Tax=Cellulomonas chitinilytica TaxID=398759 RepID=A0A919U1Q9_9CELL|nr:hypothetical protein [Cellulomonas chitinilytica]GIG21636.1 hypothetical protein Cch01nite_23600 [Cellulomonas chitinilytica]
MIDRDQVLLESTATHRERVAAALLFGPLDERRKAPTNVKRFVVSVVLAAVACVGCLGFSFVVGLLDDRRQEQAVASLTAAMAANPLPETESLVTDPGTGFLRDTGTGELVDPRTGFPVDEDTGYVRTPDGRWQDPRTGWFVDPATGYLTDPASGVTVDPETMTVVKEDQ